MISEKRNNNWLVRGLIDFTEPRMLVGRIFVDL